jgi:hypothetical protein
MARQAEAKALGVDRRVLREISAIYAEMPEVPCRGLCQEGCGPLGMSGIELARLKRASGLEVIRTDADATCPLLDRGTGKCSQYERRPLVCRAWGAAAGLPCPHGCRARTPIDDARVRGLARRLAALSERAGYPRQEITL